MIDDMLVCGHTQEEHDQQLHLAVLERIKLETRSMTRNVNSPSPV